MEKNDILDVLEDLGYSGELQDEEKLTKAVEEGPASVDYTSCVEWVVKELQEYCGTEESVNAIAIPGEGGDNFLMELGAFLREYGCPHTALYEGPVSERLQSTESRLRLLDYLLGELCAVRMIATDRPSKLRVSTQPSTAPEDNESDVAKHMKMMCQALGFPKPPDNIDSFQLFSKIESKVKELITKDPSLVGNPLLKCNLSPKQWEEVMKINTVLSDEYLIRREMLLKRLDVTIQSFMWSDTAKRNENAIAAAYQPIRTQLSSKVNVTVPAIMAARDDLTRLQKTSSGEARKKTICKINKVLIGRVPDRGGRAWEHEPPPPEMPAFMKRDAAPQRPQSGRGGRGGGGGRGRGGGGGDSGRGGRVQGGWDGQKQSQGGNWSQGGAGYGGGGSYGGQGGFVLGAPSGGGGGQYSNGHQRGDGSYQQGGYAQGGYQQGGYQQGYQQGGYQQGSQQSYQGGYQQGGGYQGGGGGGGRGGRPGSGRGGRGGGRGGRGKGYH